MLKLIRQSLYCWNNQTLYSSNYNYTWWDKEKQNKDKPKLEKKTEVLSRETVKKEKKKKNGVSGLYQKCLTDMSLGSQKRILGQKKFEQNGPKISPNLVEDINTKEVQWTPNRMNFKKINFRHNIDRWKWI